MADDRCRSCGGTVATGAPTCPHCGVEAPLAAGAAGMGTRPETGPPPERDAGSRVGKALKAFGCLLLAGIVLAIAVIVGVFDLIF